VFQRRPVRGTNWHNPLDTCYGLPDFPEADCTLAPHFIVLC